MRKVINEVSEVENIKVKLFTHNDLDGVGNAILAQLAFGKENVDVNYCDYKQINSVVAEFVAKGGYSDYDMVYITDISVDADVAEMINKFAPNRFLLLDHHKTALHLNVNKWATVKVSSEVGIEAGTHLFYKHLLNLGYFQTAPYRDALQVFVEKVRRYDSWEWVNVYNDKNAGSLNQLLYLIGIKDFVNHYVDQFLNRSWFSVSEGEWLQMFTETHATIIKLDNKKKSAYIRRKEKQMFSIKVGKYTAGVVFAEQYISELGNELAKSYPALDYIAMIDMGSMKVSLRGIHDHIDLGRDVASNYGGGGHAKASGMNFNHKIVEVVAKTIFKINLLKKIKKFFKK